LTNSACASNLTTFYIAWNPTNDREQREKAGSREHGAGRWESEEPEG
jgi:hypothetical protein